MTTASRLYQKDALGSSDSHLVYLSLVVGTIYSHYLFRNLSNTFAKNNVWDFHSLPRQTAYYLYSKKFFLVFNFETTYSAFPAADIENY